jgi:hypothetical protein
MTHTNVTSWVPNTVRAEKMNVRRRSEKRNESAMIVIKSKKMFLSGIHDVDRRPR